MELVNAVGHTAKTLGRSTMRITVKRLFYDNAWTQGVLLIDDRPTGMYTLEDTMREKLGIPVEEWKVKDYTAIPTGTYRLIMTFSGHAQKNMPELLDVPGFTNIRIHTGNTVDDSSGCILVGYKWLGDGKIASSKLAMDDLLAEIEDAITNGLDIVCEVVNA